jgi:uncharacterized protein YciI
MPHWMRTIVLTAAPAECEEAVAAHLDHLRRLRQAGRLRLAGEFGEGDGYADVFEARDLRQAEATAAESPLVSRGLGAWTLRPWRELGLDA